MVQNNNLPLEENADDADTYVTGTPGTDAAFEARAIGSGVAITAGSVFDAQVEDFLDRVFARLVPVLPYEERHSRRDAMRFQIEQSVAAHMELGSAHAEAVSLALSQIQREQAVANYAVHPIQMTRAKPQSARHATTIALGFFGLFYLLDQTRAAGHLWNLWFGGVYSADGTIVNGPAVTAFYRFELLALPLLCGLVVGLLSRARPIRGTLNALGLLAIPAIALGGIGLALGYTELFGANQWPEWVKSCFPNPIPAVAGIAFWTALGCAAAGAGGRLRRRIPRIRNLARSRRGRRSR